MMPAYLHPRQCDVCEPAHSDIAPAGKKAAAGAVRHDFKLNRAAMRASKSARIAFAPDKATKDRV